MTSSDRTYSQDLAQGPLRIPPKGRAQARVDWSVVNTTGVAVTVTDSALATRRLVSTAVVAAGARTGDARYLDGGLLIESTGGGQAVAVVIE